ncbi:hypothetical protein F5Y17DRAFT_442021 [Xylariaceae sp. FL0594]|nr:hypothetical protein F5Y17DRAFT_442021 [Xylariaceae sp. FL0594]
MSQHQDSLAAPESPTVSHQPDSAAAPEGPTMPQDPVTAPGEEEEEEAPLVILPKGKPTAKGPGILDLPPEIIIEVMKMLGKKKDFWHLMLANKRFANIVKVNERTLFRKMMVWHIGPALADYVAAHWIGEEATEGICNPIGLSGRPKDSRCFRLADNRDYDFANHRDHLTMMHGNPSEESPPTGVDQVFDFSREPFSLGPEDMTVSEFFYILPYHERFVDYYRRYRFIGEEPVEDLTDEVKSLRLDHLMVLFYVFYILEPDDHCYSDSEWDYGDSDASDYDDRIKHKNLVLYEGNHDQGWEWVVYDDHDGAGRVARVIVPGIWSGLAIF